MVGFVRGIIAPELAPVLRYAASNEFIVKNNSCDRRGRVVLRMICMPGSTHTEKTQEVENRRKASIDAFRRIPPFREFRRRLRQLAAVRDGCGSSRRFATVAIARGQIPEESQK